MISGGVTTVYVSDMNHAVHFYTDVLGLKLTYRHGDHWAQIDAGDGMRIGLHPVTEHTPKSGIDGSVNIGLNVDQPLDIVVTSLQQRGAQFLGPIVADEKGGIRLAFLRDMDGNTLYLCEYLSKPQGS